MKSRIAFRILPAWFLPALLLSGCATYNTAQNIHPWGDETQGRDSISGVTAAWREADGDLRICVTGTPAERSENMAMLFPGADFSVVFPAGSYESRAADAPKLYRTKAPEPEFNLTASHIEGPCPTPSPNSIPVSVRRAQPGDLGVESFVYADDTAMTALFAASPPGPTVFELAGDLSSDLYYRADAAIFDGSRIVEIALALRDVEPRPAWILALPFALAFDAATSPVQLFICLFSVGCAT